MKKQYLLADNCLAISAPDNMKAWESVEPRFRPFAAAEAGRPVLEVDIREGRLEAAQGEWIYEPAPPQAGFIAGRVLRRPDGSLLLEFCHTDETAPRLWLTMNPQLNRAEILLAPGGDDNNTYFLAHALMIAFMLATCGNGTLVFHSSAILFNGRAYLFQGKSGTGKSTHARLWTSNIAGAEPLNDDNPLVRFDAKGHARAYGSPWSGKSSCYRNLSAPVGAFVRIVRAGENELRPLAPLRAYASLTASAFYMPFLNDRLKEVRHRTLERLASTVCCCEMHCRPDADAAMTCRRGLEDNVKSLND